MQLTGHPNVIQFKEVSFNYRSLSRCFFCFPPLQHIQARPVVGGTKAYQSPAPSPACSPPRCLTLKPIPLPQPNHPPQAFLTTTHLGIAMEYASGGDLFDRVVSRRRLPEPEARYFFWQLVQGLVWCHSQVGVVEGCNGGCNWGPRCGGGRVWVGI